MRMSQLSFCVSLFADKTIYIRINKVKVTQKWKNKITIKPDVSDPSGPFSASLTKIKTVFNKLK